MIRSIVNKHGSDRSINLLCLAWYTESRRCIKVPFCKNMIQIIGIFQVEETFSSEKDRHDTSKVFVQIQKLGPRDVFVSNLPSYLIYVLLPPLQHTYSKPLSLM